MNTVLHIDTSARSTDNSVAEYNSISKTLAVAFMDNWLANNNEDKVIYRDLSLNPPGFVNQDWIAAVITPEDKRTNEQKELLK